MIISNPSILITDDDQQFRETVRGVLAPRGYRTLLAGSGSEALDIVQREDVHVVLLDMHMPWLTGLETLRLVKQLKSRLPCILLSGRMDEELRREAEAAQAFWVLSKPVTRLQLTSIVELALARSFGQN
ncbi:MAG: response regulator [Planctomycetes bacterium]|nr:response regulator [Planctomycetota bacterium]